jgi:hypothetical protein
VKWFRTYDLRFGTNASVSELKFQNNEPGVTDKNMPKMCPFFIISSNSKIAKSKPKVTNSET